MSRILYFDFLRGLAIILVVCLHCIQWENMDRFTLDVIGVEFRNLLNVAVPLFLAVSGYFMATKKVDDTASYKGFLKKQLARVYLPLLIWSVPYLVLSYLHHENPIVSWLLFFSGGYSIYYFIILIVQFYLLLPLLQRIGRSLKGVVCTVVISLISISVLEILLYVCHLDIPLILSAGPFPLWIMFFVTGIYLRTHSVNLRFIYPLAGLFYLLSVAESFSIMQALGQVKGLGIKFFSFLFSLYFIILLFVSPFKQFVTLHQDHFLIRNVVRIGEISFGIYLIHMFIQMILDKLIGYHGFNFILVLAVSIVVILVVRKITPSSVHKYIGFS